MNEAQEHEYLQRCRETVENAARNAIEDLRLARSVEPNCLFASEALIQSAMHVGCRDDRPGTINGHIDPETRIGKLHIFNLPVFPLEWLQGFECLAAVLAKS